VRRFLIQEIKSRIPLGYLLPKFGFPIPPRPKKSRSCCLLHSGDNPTSSNVDLIKTICHRFVCGRDDDQITFIQEAFGSNFKDALRGLAIKQG